MGKRLKIRCRHVNPETGERCRAPAFMNLRCKMHHKTEGVGAVLKVDRARALEGETIRDKEWNAALALKYLDKIRQGYSPTRVCKMEGMPAYSVVKEWREAYPPFNRAYENARNDLADQFVDQIVDIADDTSVEVMRARLQVEARKTAAQLLKPDRYGNRLNVEAGVTEGLANRLIEAQKRVKQGKTLDHQPRAADQKAGDLEQA